MKRKVLSLVLALVMCLGLAAPALASTNTTTGRVSYENVTDTSIDMIAPGALSEVFDTASAYNLTSDEATIDEVSYSYTFVPQENDPTSADVTVSFTMYVDGQSYPADAAGTVRSYELYSGDVLWEGPIDGTVVIGETLYDVVAGFCMLDGSPDVQITVTLQTFEADISEPLIFMFGEHVVTAQMIQELNERASAASSETLSEEMDAPMAAPQANGFNLLSSGSSKLTANSNITAQTGYGYFNSADRQFAVGIQSYCGNLETYYSGLGYTAPSTSIDSFSVRLNGNTISGAGQAWTGAILLYQFSENNVGKESLIRPLFYDIMNLLNVPTYTIDAILNGLKGTVTKDIGYNSYVTVTFGLMENANFDDAHVPAVFQLTRNGGNTGNVASSFTYVTQIKYRTTITDPVSSVGTLVYANGQDVSKNVSIVVR